ncbi:uncharacterized protein [Pyxicephalus adspersus]|uniref:uncharacterized protein n=1 Tax=Pyxicephalus adspersus TaxID=30357 RepID=UPI003B5B159B
MDSDSQAQLSKKRSRQRYEGDPEDNPSITAKKRKCQTNRKHEEVIEEMERDEERARRKAKKIKKRLIKEKALESFLEESLESNKSKKHSEDSTYQKAAQEILNLLKPNLEPSAKGVRERSISSSSSDQDPSTSHQDPSTLVNDPSEISIQPITTIPIKKPSTLTLRLFAALSMKKNSGISLQNLGTLSVNMPSEMSLKPLTFSGKNPSKKSAKPISEISNHESLARKSRDISSSDLEPSPNQKSSTKEKKPSKGQKSRTKSKANELPAKSAKQISSSDSSESDHESSTKGKKHSKVPNKAGAAITVNKTKANDLPAKSATQISSSDSSESDHESSTIGKKPSKVPNKAGAAITVNKTNANDLPAKSATQISSSDSSESDHESSTIGKKPSKVPNKAGVAITVNKTKANHKLPKSSMEYSSSSYDQNPSEATSNPRKSEMMKRKDSSAPDKVWSSENVVIALPTNGTSQNPHKEICSDSDIWIKKPVTVQHTDRRETGVIHEGILPNYGRGRGRGGDLIPWKAQIGRGFRGRGDQGKGRGYGNQFFHNYNSPVLKKQQLEEPATNTSVIIQNPPEMKKKDYNTFPLLAAPPQVGKVIAFKILELNESYSPELSDYKEGIVRSYDPVTEQIKVELLSVQKRREPGKFDLVYESEDGKEIVEYAVLPDSEIVEPWSSLVSPRLVMEMGSEEGTAPQPL